MKKQHKKFHKKKEDNNTLYTFINNVIFNFLLAENAIWKNIINEHMHLSVLAATGEIHLFESEVVVALNQRKWNRAHHYVLPSGAIVYVLYLFKYGLENEC